MVLYKDRDTGVSLLVTKGFKGFNRERGHLWTVRATIATEHIQIGHGQGIHRRISLEDLSDIERNSRLCPFYNLDHICIRRHWARSFSFQDRVNEVFKGLAVHSSIVGLGFNGGLERLRWSSSNGWHGRLTEALVNHVSVTIRTGRCLSFGSNRRSRRSSRDHGSRSRDLLRTPRTCWKSFLIIHGRFRFCFRFSLSNLALKTFGVFNAFCEIHKDLYRFLFAFTGVER